MIQRTTARVAAIAAAALALTLTGCAPATAPAPSETPRAAAAPTATPTETPGTEPAPSTDSAWPAGWTEELPHPTSGTVLYSHTERAALYKIGLVSTPEAFGALVTEFGAAGYADEAGRDDEGDEHAEVHNFTKDGWRVILRGVSTGAGFELHYLAKQER
ncbi:hypothetical protein [Microterricola viridarii]|uniref:Lipoprotein n=1 Tax=Microterricola viridarii TaxID=412690 RepID=A0A1H1UWL9_9MICO|nr:hypothetical protein [Microterricola viridarii]SDS76922.1 hypothetical protein SAMN04489834_2112 [Microterricola viridarii]